MMTRSYAVACGGRTLRVTILGKNRVKVDDTTYEIDFVHLGAGKYSLRLNGTDYVAFYCSSAEGEGELYLGHAVIPIALLQPEQVIARQMKKGIIAGSSSVTVRAPMPGLIKSTLCSVGDQVNRGTALFILEAMKMENEIRTDDPGTIARINIKAGDKVEKGQALLELQLK